MGVRGSMGFIPGYLESWPRHYKTSIITNKDILTLPSSNLFQYVSLFFFFFSTSGYDTFASNKFLRLVIVDKNTWNSLCIEAAPKLS